MICIEKVKITKGDSFVLEIPEVIFKPAEQYLVAGPSGSGKSTLLRVAVGLETPDKGRIYRKKGSSTVDIMEKNAQKGLFLMSQENGLWPNLTVLEHIRFTLNRGNPYRKNPEEESILNGFGLNRQSDLKPQALSWGQRRRLSLARALALNPMYLFLDEPFANIDMVHANELNTLLYREADSRGIAVIQVTHYPFLPTKLNKVLVVDLNRVMMTDSVEKAAEFSSWTKKWAEMVK